MDLTRPLWLVLGIGNVLMRDEGAGVHVVRNLETLQPFPDEVELLDGGTLSFSLAPLLQGLHGLIVVDAASLDAPPGTIRIFEGRAMDDFLGRTRRLSVHEVCLNDLLCMAHACGELPAHRALVGIQPASIDWDEAPGPEVALAIPQAASRIMGILDRWRSPAAAACTMEAS